MFNHFDVLRVQNHVRDAKHQLGVMRNPDRALKACVDGLEDAAQFLQLVYERLRHPSYEVGQIVKVHGKPGTTRLPGGGNTSRCIQRESGRSRVYCFRSQPA